MQVLETNIGEKTIGTNENFGLHWGHIFYKLHTYTTVITTAAIGMTTTTTTTLLVAQHRVVEMHHVWWERFVKRLPDLMPSQQPGCLSPLVEHLTLPVGVFFYQISSEGVEEGRVSEDDAALEEMVVDLRVDGLDCILAVDVEEDGASHGTMREAFKHLLGC